MRQTDPDINTFIIVFYRIWTCNVSCACFKNVGKTNGGNRKSCCVSHMFHPNIFSNQVLLNLPSCRAVYSSQNYMISRWLQFSCCQCFDKLSWCLRVRIFHNFSYTAPRGLKRCDQGNLFQILTKQAICSTGYHRTFRIARMSKELKCLATSEML